MPIPTIYNEPLLQHYMLNQTGNLGVVLSLTATNFIEAVADTLLAYGATDIANATDIAKLRALAKVEAWKVAVAHAAGYIEFTADGSSFKANQMHQQALAGLEAAETAAMEFGLSNYMVTVATLRYSNDPYPLPSDEDE